MTYLENSPSLNPLKDKASVKMAGCPVLNTGHFFDELCDSDYIGSPKNV